MILTALLKISIRLFAQFKLKPPAVCLELKTIFHKIDFLTFSVKSLDVRIG